MYSGNVVSRKRAQVGGGRGPAALGSHVGHQPLGAALVRRREHHGLRRRPGEPAGAASTSPELDAEAPHLDLVVDAAQELERAVGPPAHQVARAVQPRPRSARKRVGHELLGRPRRPVEIAARQPDAAQHQLPRHPRGHRSELRVEHVGPACWRSAGRSAARPRRHLRSFSSDLDRGEDRRLGGPIAVEQPPAAACPARRPDSAEQASPPTLTDRSTASDSSGSTESSEGVTTAVLTPCSTRRLVSTEGVSALLLAHQAEAPAVRQRQEDLQHRGVEPTEAVCRIRLSGPT